MADHQPIRADSDVGVRHRQLTQVRRRPGVYGAGRLTRASSNTGSSDSYTAPSAPNTKALKRSSEPPIVGDGEHGALETCQRLFRVLRR